MKNALAALIVVAAAGSVAHADQFNASITADNHYALYTSSGGVFTYLGGNETGSSGTEGSYNWSAAELYSFHADEYIYIAAWSDDSTAQGVLAELNSAVRGPILSGDSRWQVYATNTHRGDGDPHPGADDIEGFVAAANLANAWETPFTGASNGAQPWGMIEDISSQAAWMWRNDANDIDPTIGAPAHTEMLVFRTAVPAPATGAMALAGVMLVARRRR